MIVDFARLTAASGIQGTEALAKLLFFLLAPLMAYATPWHGHAPPTLPLLFEWRGYSLLSIELAARLCFAYARDRSPGTRSFSGRGLEREMSTSAYERTLPPWHYNMHAAVAANALNHLASDIDARRLCGCALPCAGP